MKLKIGLTKFIKKGYTNEIGNGKCKGKVKVFHVLN